MTASHPSGQGKLSSFPFLTKAEFMGACHAFLDRIQAAGIERVGWSSIRLQRTGPALRISQSFNKDCPQENALTPHVEIEHALDSQLETCEEDPEALTRTFESQETLQIDYDILLSPTYQVPVLYFILRRSDKLLGTDEVYSSLVLDHYKKNIQSVGIMGGISFGYHPVSGTPAFFVHPCNTADAMRDIADGHDISPETYLIIWLGLTGNCVRLRLPSELFATAEIPENQRME
ncbi:hypothetical protein BJY04DRAFT_162002 [Aspergillus karnatakaensis]|uniref:ATG3/ATG10 family protein n=1 Tax=Aspergillus karnatakaensis TaxID=1810916 RepID=UPI003CCDAD19